MKSIAMSATALAGSRCASASTLASICTTTSIQNSLPGNDFSIQGLVFGDVTAQPVYNSSVQAGNNYPAASGRNFCNVTVAYSHAGRDDAVRLAVPKNCCSTRLTFTRRSMYGTTSPNRHSTKVAFWPPAAVALPSTLALQGSREVLYTAPQLAAPTAAWAGVAS